MTFKVLVRQSYPIDTTHLIVRDHELQIQHLSLLYQFHSSIHVQALVPAGNGYGWEEASTWTRCMYHMYVSHSDSIVKVSGENVAGSEPERELSDAQNTSSFFSSVIREGILPVTYL